MAAPADTLLYYHFIAICNDGTYPIMGNTYHLYNNNNNNFNKKKVYITIKKDNMGKLNNLLVSIRCRFSSPRVAKLIGQM